MIDRKYWVESKDGNEGPETVLDAELVSQLPLSVSEKDADTYLPGLLAAAVMREAKVAGLDRRREGPFAKEVKLHYPEEGYEGGKPDDIAVVVCIAVDGSAGHGEEKPIKAKL